LACWLLVVEILGEEEVESHQHDHFGKHVSMHYCKKSCYQDALDVEVEVGRYPQNLAQKHEEVQDCHILSDQLLGLEEEDEPSLFFVTYTPIEEQDSWKNLDRNLVIEA